VSDNVVRIKRQPRPLQKTYQPKAPYVVHRQDHDDNSITYDVIDERPDTYRIVCAAYDFGDNPHAKHDAEQIARGLNLLVQLGKEKLPNVRDRD
jgi:hypothetical protein